MRIIHINRNYFTNRIHRNIISALDNREYSNVVFVFHYGEYAENSVDGRFLELLKLPKILKYLPIIRSFIVSILIYRTLNVKSGGVNFKIHAHTLCADGMIALFLSYFLKCKYFCTVRNSDVNAYLKKAFYLRPFVKKVATRSEYILFLTPAYIKKLKTFNIYFPEKSIILPSFVDEYWHENLGEEARRLRKRENSEDLKFIYIGGLIKEKRILELLRYCIDRDVALDIYGDGVLRSEVLEISKKSNGNITYQGIAQNKDLPNILLNYNILISFSPYESFGLVLLEAMFCGVIPIFAKNEGIDGFFEWHDLTIDVFNFEDVDRMINKLKTNYKEYSTHLANTDFSIFKEQYFLKIYSEIIEG